MVKEIKESRFYNTFVLKMKAEIHESVLAEILRLNLKQLSRDDLEYQLAELTIQMQSLEEYQSKIFKKLKTDFFELAGLPGDTLGIDYSGMINTAAKIQRSKTGSKAGKKRAEKDPKTKMLEEIRTKHEENKNWLKLRGRTTEFVNRMSAQYPELARGTISNLVTKLNKKLKQITPS